MAPSTLSRWIRGPGGAGGRCRSMASTAAVWTASYAAPAASVVRRSVAAENVTPGKKA
jgi:hypothetical protein